MANINISGLIRTARERAGLTQREVGEALGYVGTTTQVIVAQWESGVRPVPLDKMRALASILRIDVADLIP